MPNIWHIWHTKYKNGPSLGVLNVLKLWNMLQYAFVFESVWMKMPFSFIVFLFIFLSPLSSLYSSSFFLSFFLFSPLSFFLRHSYQPISSFTLFSSNCCCFSLFCSTLPRHLMQISIAVGFFIFFASDLMVGFDSEWLLSSVQPRRTT